MDVKLNVAAACAEVEIAEKDMPKAVAQVARKLYPKCEIREIKRETRTNGSTVHALEIFIGSQQYDLEVTPDGKVLRNEKG